MITLKSFVHKTATFTHPVQTGASHVQYDIASPMSSNPDEVLLFQKTVVAVHFERSTWTGLDVNGSELFGYDTRWELDNPGTIRIRVYRLSSAIVNIYFKFIWN